MLNLCSKNDFIRDLEHVRCVRIEESSTEHAVTCQESSKM
jgi:hypothetical protein